MYNKSAAPTEFEQQIVGHSLAFQYVLNQVGIIAKSDSVTLIQGETGTGKEVIARAIHNESLRNRGPFVKLNCAAIPGALLESELFGHERGAFTGAVTQTIGRFQQADNGTLFLDEIGDLPLELQPKLLRALQEQEFERLGCGRTIRVNVRVVAATNQDLAQMVSSRQFRADLYYRLNVIPIFLPPLRERPDDIPRLVEHFVQKYAARLNKVIDTIPEEVMEEYRLRPRSQALARPPHWQRRFEELSYRWRFKRGPRRKTGMEGAILLSNRQCRGLCSSRLRGVVDGQCRNRDRAEIFSGSIR
jgi:transcriptional regulator with GAF, ATPase, and Fis domain